MTARWSRAGKFSCSCRIAKRRMAGRGVKVGVGSGNARANRSYHAAGGAKRADHGCEGRRATLASARRQWLVYRSGKSDEDQLYALPVVGIDSAKPVQLTYQTAGVGLWKWSPDAKRIYFVTADTLDKDEKLRMEKKFNVAIRNMATPLSSLWAFDVDAKKATRLTRDTSTHRHHFNTSR